MKILVTGVCGFIGFNLAKKFLELYPNSTVYGIDNFDNYYSVKLKKVRLKLLKEFKNFNFKNVDIFEKNKIKLYFKNKKFDYVIHLAAQAGVRYSLVNPKKFIQVNLLGYLNLLNELKNKKPKKIFYASSSSVYGDNVNFPLKEKEKLNPKNIYGVSKKLNEDISKYYTKKFNLNMIGMRFFTIYGEWGRPDMFFLKLFKSAFTKEIFNLNNRGNHHRDFTYIGDIFSMINILIVKKTKKNDVYNFCSNNPIDITKIVNKVKKRYPVKINLRALQKADIIKTHGSNIKIIKKTKYTNFMKIDEGFESTLNWYKKNKIYKF
tara:strand:- start:1 stop:960 length:960 start_codon:yes stop_codon:yes gene_type:complete